MKSIIIVVIAVLVIGGGIWFFSETEWGGEVLDREEEREVGEMEEIDMDEAELMEIIAKGEDVASVSYEVEMDSPEMTMKGYFWQKGPKMRVETETMEGAAIEEETIAILDNEEKILYTYMPDQERAIKLDLSEAEEFKEGSMKEQTERLPEQQPVVVGVETIRGKECIVVEYTPDEETTGKMWIWREHGLPIRVEIDDMVTEAKNIDFGAVSDDKFELPEGVEIIETPTIEVPPIETSTEELDLDDFDPDDFEDLDIDF